MLFTTIIVLGFGAAVVDHWYYGNRAFNPSVRVLYLGCVIAIDGWLAITVNPALFLWVLLYVWGVWNVIRGVRGES